MLEDLGPMPGMASFGVHSPGHEGAGVVAKLGPGVTGWKVGDRAGMRPMYDVCHVSSMTPSIAMPLAC